MDTVEAFHDEDNQSDDCEIQGGVIDDMNTSQVQNDEIYD